MIGRLRRLRSIDGLGVRAAIGAVVITLVGSAVATQALGLGSGNPILTHPRPALFPAAQVQTLGDELAAQKAFADKAFATWLTTHPARDDAAFVAFAVQATPASPDQAHLAGELTELRQLQTTRTPAGIAAATWLEVYGKTDVWKLYRKQYADLAPAADGNHAKTDLATVRALAKQVTAAAQARYHQDAPFITQPALRPDKNVTPGSHKYSYPSKHAVDVYAEDTLLSALDPARATEFHQMAGEVAYSRLYMAGHYRSDLTAGAFLGYLIGDYVTHLRHA